jgi:BirA family biotin operon repressor/biotin-[acetyl-CoA-carboxylase] ligase
MDGLFFQTILHDLPLGEIKYFKEIGSTNDEALRWLERGAQENSLVIADSQTKGRGRFDRRWITKPDSGLAFSLICKPKPTEMNALNLFSPLGAVAVCQALEETFQITPEIKWPNDILLNGMKICGILAESSWEGSTCRGVVMGIGINISIESLPSKDQTRFPATCVEKELGMKIDRVDLLKKILQKVISCRETMLLPAFLEYWSEHLAYRDQTVVVEEGAVNKVVGILKGVAPNGSLEIKLTNGEIRIILVGDVRLKKAEEREEVRNAG